MSDRQHLELLLRNLPGAFFFVDRSGRITDFNPALLRRLGMEGSQLLGHPPEELLDPAGLDSTGLTHPAGGGHYPYIRTALRHSNGDRVPVLLGLAPVEHEGERYGVLVMALELEHLESSRPGPLFDPLDSLDRLKAALMAMASRELRTPLAIIKGYTGAFLTGELGAGSANFRPAGWRS